MTLSKDVSLEHKDSLDTVLVVLSLLECLAQEKQVRQIKMLLTVDQEVCILQNKECIIKLKPPFKRKL
jgi:hypothetical protein